MKKVCIASACAFAAAFAAFCDTAVWLESGTGGWSSPNRWVDGKVPVPSADNPWTVTIPDCANAVVTDADKEYFEALGQLNINSHAVLTVTNDADLALYAYAEIYAKQVPIQYRKSRQQMGGV